MDRLNLIRSQLVSLKLANNENTLSVIDNRTGKDILIKEKLISLLSMKAY